MGSLRTLVEGLLVLLTLHCCSAKYLIAAPNLLRVGVEETISITVFGTDSVVTIKLELQDYPDRKKTFSQVEGKFRKDQPGILKIKVNANDLSDQKSLDNQYVYLRASSATPGFQFNDEIRILVSYRNAIVFIQTDKPIYNPGQSVNLRVVPLDLELKASLKNVTIEVLNPQGIRVNRWKDLNTKKGFFSKTEYLSKNALLGNWTINALYGHGLVQNASVQFEVREYILPKFSVKIEGPDYILKSTKVVPLTMTSKYTYGKSVQGTLQLNLAILDDAGKTERFNTARIKLNNGVVNYLFSTDLIKNHPKNLWFPDGKRLLIEAKVIEKATGKQEEALHNTIYFTTSPLKISFRRTPKFFKPGVQFVIKVDVTYLNGEPAENINLELDAKTDEGTAVQEKAEGGKGSDTTDKLGHGSFTVDVPKTFTIKHLDIKVTAVINKGTTEELRTHSVLQPMMYRSPGQNYLLLKFAAKGRIGQKINGEAYVVSTGSPLWLSYMVVVRGKVLTQGTIARKLGVVTTVSFDVTSAMSPEARVIAYYTVRNELVVDSAVIEVDERLPNSVTFAKGLSLQETPGDSYIVKLEADPYSRIGILAVDQSVYLLRNDKQLTIDKVFKRIKAHDLGCGPGAGQNNKDVLSRAGLAVMLDVSSLKTDTRTDQQCSAAARRRRRSVDDQPTCCTFGEATDPGTCLARAKAFSVSNVSAAFHPLDDCVIAFYKCCRNKFELDSSSRGRSSNDALPGNLLDDINLGLNQAMLQDALNSAQIRTDFPETWVNEDAIAGKDGRVQFKLTIPGTITTWVMQAISVSNTTGFGLTPPHFLKAFKEFFVSLSMPYSAQRGEQVSIVATVYNYISNAGQVNLYLNPPPSKEFCTYVEPTLKYAFYKMNVKAHSAASVSFPVVPTVVGNIPIKVSAVNMKSFMGDIVVRQLKVVPEGMERIKTTSITLDPHDILRDPTAPKPVKPKTPSATQSSTKENGVQRDRVSLVLPEFTVPESESAQLTVIGNFIGPVVSNVIQGKGLNNIIRMPSGCGEQTMLRLAPNVFVLQYLRSTKQVTDQIETTAFNFILSGYQRELNYRRSDNSFSAFGNSRPGSTWLTAFVIKTFCAIQKFGREDVDQQVVCSAINWLSSIQQPDGAIPERHPVIHQEMNGDINGEIAMTAYVVTALLECHCNTQNTYRTMKKAVTYLENKRASIGRVYVKAVVAYALALASSPHKDAANKELLATAKYDAGKNTRHWTDGGNAINVETTSYALLTQMALKRTGYAGPIVVWLTEQRKGGGGFVSTQDTCVALQALAAYSQAAGRNHLDLKVVITSDVNGKYKETISVDKHNALVQQQLDLSSLMGGDVYIKTEGTGVAQLQVETRYNTPKSELEVCQFDLTVSTVERVKRQFDQPRVILGRRQKKKKRPGKKQRNRSRKRGGKRGRRKNRRKNRRGGRRNRRRRPKPKVKPTKKPSSDQPSVPNSISFKICTRYKKAGETAGMSIIDVGILTGFSHVQESLVELRDKVKPGIAKFEVSDRHVVLYVDKIPSTHELCFTLEMKRDFEVGIVQPVPVTVYDYYEPDNKCTKYYGPEKNSHLSLAACDDDSCKCVQDKCTNCKPSKDVEEVHRMICDDTYDFVLRGTVVSIDERNNWLTIKVDTKDIIKFGSNAIRRNSRLLFRKQASCSCPKVEIDKDYLIMGTDHNFAGGKITLNNNVYVNEWRHVKKVRKRLTGKKDPCS